MSGLCVPVKLEQAESSQSISLAQAFGLGWAAADESHLPALPEALAHILRVSAVHMSITHWNGKLLLNYAYPAMEDRGENEPTIQEVELDLGTEYVLRLSIESATALSDSQSEILSKTVRLIHAALDRILIRLRDRGALGEPFARLSDREWQICLALESPGGEKQIAGALQCSPHTVHSYIKSLYRKLQVQSRLQVLEQLKRVREEIRRRNVGEFE